MSSHSALRALSLVCIIFPSIVAGRGGGGKGRGGGIISGSGGGDGDGDSLAPLFLQPIDAAIFAFCVIFGVVTGYQVFLAGRNIYQRVAHRPPSITLPEYSVGPIFPTSLFLSTFMLMTYYVLYGVFWGISNNQNVSPEDIPDFGNPYFNALNVMSYLADIFLVLTILALLSHRERVLGGSINPVIRDVKIVFDAVLVVILLALGMGRCGLSAVVETQNDIKTSANIYIAYASFFFIAAVDIAGSSILLYFRAKRSQVNDHQVRHRVSNVHIPESDRPSHRHHLSQISLLAAFAISPLFFIYALYPLILLHFDTRRPRVEYQLRLASLIIGCITEFGIIATCLKLGIPVIRKPKKVVEDS